MKKQQNKTVNNKNTDTIIGEGIIFKDALLKGSGIVRIDGRFTGNIDIEGHIILGEKGFVVGDVFASSALLAGDFQGNLNIKDTLHLTPTAVLNGKVETGKLIIDEGAVLDGTCNVIKDVDNRNSSLVEVPLNA